MAKLIETISDHCHECYACVRNCPVKAVRVKDGQAEVIEERCINCTNCVKICSQGAKKVLNYKKELRLLLKEKNRVVVGLAPSFPSYDPEYSLDDWIRFLNEIGFSEIYEVAWGAELIINEYRKLLKSNDSRPIISTACPVVVNFVEKYFPELTGNLAQIVSPMGALGRYIKKVEKEDVKIIMIGPCHAKKREFDDKEEIDYVMTYSEVVELGEKLDIELRSLNSEDRSEQIEASKRKYVSKEKVVDSARKIPLAGGLLEAVSQDEEKENYLKVEGSEKIFELFQSMVRGEIEPKFVDALFCEGCINGIDFLEKNYFKKKSAVMSFIHDKKYQNGSVEKYNKELLGKINLFTTFKKDPQNLPEPSEEDIWMILNQTNKYSEEDLLNCGACGYNSCKEKARAVYQGLAEVEMCLPYLLTEKRSEIKEIQGLNRELDTLINSSYDGMAILNNKGTIEKINDAYLNMIGLTRKELIGKKVYELESEQVIYPSVAALTLHEKRDITLVQNVKNEKRILVTASPIINNSGQIEKVVVNARDLKELDLVVDDSSDKKNPGQYSNEINKNKDGTGHIISYSKAMKRILKLANKIGNTNSTVIITGESGVGKEVVARYIHEQSRERENFVKINCAAIPEQLLESELFGYETGAFSGARREGKKGLIEKADNGTLFLDEIAEMPLNMQAKLLQVIQEYSVTRIGGVEPIDVNFRLITATNKNLEDMVKKNKFREDLYYRLNVVPIDIPSLKERRSDILPLVEYYTDRINKKYSNSVSFADKAKELLVEYDWPGNVRELNNLIERIIITSERKIIDRDYLNYFIEEKTCDKEPDIIVNSVIPLKDAVARLEKELLDMAREKGKTTYEMANILGVNQSTIVRKMKKYFS